MGIIFLLFWLRIVKFHVAIGINLHYAYYYMYLCLLGITVYLCK